jgi:hypothetical protein
MNMNEPPAMNATQEAVSAEDTQASVEVVPSATILSSEEKDPRRFDMKYQVNITPTYENKDTKAQAEAILLSLSRPVAVPGANFTFTSVSDGTPNTSPEGADINAQTIAPPGLPSQIPILTDVVEGGVLTPKTPESAKTTQFMEALPKLTVEVAEQANAAPEQVTSEPIALDAGSFQATPPSQELESTPEIIAKASLTEGEFARQFGSRGMQEMLAQGLQIPLSAVALDIDKRFSGKKLAMTAGVGGIAALSSLPIGAFMAATGGYGGLVAAYGTVLAGGMAALPVAGALLAAYGGLKWWQKKALKKRFEENFSLPLELVLGDKKQ